MAMGRKLLATGVAATGIALALPAVPAVAGPTASGRFGVEVVDVDETTTVRNFCGVQGLTVTIHDVEHSRGFFTFRGAESIPAFHGNTRGSSTITDVATGTTVRIVFNTVDKDLHIVDNGDGTLTITALGAGNFKVIGPERTLRDPGRIVFQFTVDTNGTPQDPFDDPEPDPDSFTIIRDSTGLNELGPDFCSDYLMLTGRA